MITYDHYKMILKCVNGARSNYGSSIIIWYTPFEVKQNTQKTEMGCHSFLYFALNSVIINVNMTSGIKNKKYSD